MRLNVPTHYLTRDFQFPGDHLFPKGTLVHKGKRGFIAVDENGHDLCAYTGRFARPWEAIAGYDIGPDMKHMFRAIPEVGPLLKVSRMYHSRGMGYEQRALSKVKKFVEGRKAKRGATCSG